ncbi:ADP-ribosylglycohydrolase [Terrimicrobium sacchariphilum]|uniref:ADP-ribosylglycohydrolase n=1 Tax=Terrimicrobium sacchariphilum TaxID=690879 RepID=A0A146G3S7_TERSA|nr:ADP-ribosylglycohydrolase family protein [Terrimicrobium sacchariphilum]GAT32291.1 ADP-ribosylglycohydrolase [Terrimicrobium sacchariphilum]
MPQTLPSKCDLISRIQGCWLGKSIGGTLGLPAEGRMERLNFSFYDPVPTIAPPNDDLELQLVWLHMVEQGGDTLTRADFARAWLESIHYMWDEYGVCRWNLRRGVPAESTGTFENHFHAGMGSPIRSEIWACLFPGDPESTAYHAALDASLDHGREGIAGEVLVAVMQSLVAGGAGLDEAITASLGYLPAGTETLSAVQFVRRAFVENVPAWECWKELLVRHGNENFTHAPLNVALTIWALLYGEEDFEASVLLAANGGYDTDCTAASVGATLGLLNGVESIPARWSEPIGDGVFVGPGILGIDVPPTLDELSRRTERLIGKLKPRRWNRSEWDRSLPAVHLRDLPGTIELHPAGSAQSIPWANGELPVEIKKAGGGTWTWECLTDESRHIICLAREGARLFIDGELAIECPPHLPYVPATHRSSDLSRVAVTVGSGVHAIRLELNSSSAEQEASVILAYPNLHIAPWTAQELPHPALLPAQ